MPFLRAASCFTRDQRPSHPPDELEILFIGARTAA
jgi:hypothetical protein